MIPIISFIYEIGEDTIDIVRSSVDTPNIFDYSSLGELPVIIGLNFLGNKRIGSDGLMGAIVDGAPTSANIVLIQEHHGILVEVARLETEDGSYMFTKLAGKKTHAIALKEGFNAGITADIQPEA